MSARQRNRRRNELAEQIAAARKGAGFLEMITPAHAKSKVKLTEEEMERRREAAKKARASAKLQLHIKAAFETTMESWWQQMMLTSPPSAFFGPSAGGLVGNLKGRGSSFIVRPVQSPVSAPPVLEELKSAPAQKVASPVEKPMPDYVEVITGWRAWDVKHTPEGLRLESIGRSELWEPRQPKNARCQARTTSGFFGLSRYLSIVDDVAINDHPAPGFNCDCGIWAFKDLDTLMAALGRYEISVHYHVVGQVSLWGRVVETENGWRAETAYPSELWDLIGNLSDLSWIYNVPIRSKGE